MRHPNAKKQSEPIRVFSKEDVEKLYPDYYSSQLIIFNCKRCGKERITSLLQFKYRKMDIYCGGCKGLLTVYAKNGENKRKSPRTTKLFQKDPITIQNFSELADLRKSYRVAQQRINFYCKNCGKLSGEGTIKSMELSQNTELLCSVCRVAKTKKQRYGVAGYNNPGKHSETMLNRPKDEKEKTKNLFLKTMRTRYGIGLEKIVAKAKETKLLRYGDDWYTNRQKAQATIRARFGENYGEFIHQKAIQTNLKKYGVENYHGSPYKYVYENEAFDSSWELAFWIYHRDAGNCIEREPVTLKYVARGKDRNYYPDFAVNGELFEIKGEQFFDSENNLICPFDRSIDDIMKAKQECAIRNNVTFIREKDITTFLKYVTQKYGKNFLRSCRYKEVADEER